MQIVCSLNIDMIRAPSSGRPHLSHVRVVKNLSFAILSFLSFWFFPSFLAEAFPPLEQRI
jgi:hypothetical protein